jgi:hypothetical protein
MTLKSGRVDRGSVRFILRSMVLLALVKLLIGCAIGGLPTPKHRAAIQSGEKAIVLLRVTAESKDGTPLEAFGSSLVLDNVNAGLASIKTGGEFKVIEAPVFPPDDTRKQGWTYFILEPGRYYVVLVEPQYYTRQAFKRRVQNTTQRWRFDIPIGAPVVYIGTLHLYCRGEKRCNWIDEDRILLRNEEPLAQKLVEDYFKNFGSLQTVLIHRQDSRTIIIKTLDPKMDQ